MSRQPVRRRLNFLPSTPLPAPISSRQNLSSIAMPVALPDLNASPPIVSDLNEMVENVKDSLIENSRQKRKFEDTIQGLAIETQKSQEIIEDLSNENKKLKQEIESLKKKTGMNDKLAEYVKISTQKVKDSISLNAEELLSQINKILNKEYTGLGQCYKGIAPSRIQELTSEVGTKLSAYSLSNNIYPLLAEINEQSIKWQSKIHKEIIQGIRFMMLLKKAGEDGPEFTCAICTSSFQFADGSYVRWPQCRHCFCLPCFRNYESHAVSNPRYRLCPHCSTPDLTYSTPPITLSSLDSTDPLSPVSSDDEF